MSKKIMRPEDEKGFRARLRKFSECHPKFQPTMKILYRVFQVALIALLVLTVIFTVVGLFVKDKDPDMTASADVGAQWSFSDYKTISGTSSDGYTITLHYRSYGVNYAPSYSFVVGSFSDGSVSFRRTSNNESLPYVDTYFRWSYDPIDSSVSSSDSIYFGQFSDQFSWSFGNFGVGVSQSCYEFHFTKIKSSQELYVDMFCKGSSGTSKLFYFNRTYYLNQSDITTQVGIPYGERYTVRLWLYGLQIWEYDLRSASESITSPFKFYVYDSSPVYLEYVVPDRTSSGPPGTSYSFSSLALDGEVVSDFGGDFSQTYFSLFRLSGTTASKPYTFVGGARNGAINPFPNVVSPTSLSLSPNEVSFSGVVGDVASSPVAVVCEGGYSVGSISLVFPTSPGIPNLTWSISGKNIYLSFHPTEPYEGDLIGTVTSFQEESSTVFQATLTIHMNVPDPHTEELSGHFLLKDTLDFSMVPTQYSSYTFSDVFFGCEHGTFDGVKFTRQSNSQFQIYYLQGSFDILAWGAQADDGSYMQSWVHVGFNYLHFMDQIVPIWFKEFLVTNTLSSGDSDVNTVWELGWSVGYNQGNYDAGDIWYDKGFDAGYESGFDDGVVKASGLSSDWLLGFVDSFLEFKFFGTISIGLILSLFIAGWVILIFLKIFAGG